MFIPQPGAGPSTGIFLPWSLWRVRNPLQKACNVEKHELLYLAKYVKKEKEREKKQAERARIALYHKQVSLTSLVKISYIVVHEIHIHIHPGVIPWPSCDQHATGYENYDHLYISCQLLCKPAQCFSDLPRTQPCSINHQVGQQAQVL